MSSKSCQEAVKNRGGDRREDGGWEPSVPVKKRDLFKYQGADISAGGSEHGSNHNHCRAMGQSAPKLRKWPPRPPEASEVSLSRSFIPRCTFAVGILPLPNDAARVPLESRRFVAVGDAKCVGRFVRPWYRVKTVVRASVRRMDPSLNAAWLLPVGAHSAKMRSDYQTNRSPALELFPPLNVRNFGCWRDIRVPRSAFVGHS